MTTNESTDGDGDGGQGRERSGPERPEQLGEYPLGGGWVGIPAEPGGSPAKGLQAPKEELVNLEEMR